MSLTISNTIDVREHAQKLMSAPLSGITLLPRNFAEASAASEFIFEHATSTVRTLWRNNGIEKSRLLDPKDSAREIVEQSSELILPTIFIAASVFINNPVTIGVAINVLSDYVKRHMRGLPGEKRVKLNIIVERSSDIQYTQVTYEGAPEGLKDLPMTIKEVFAHGAESR